MCATAKEKQLINIFGNGMGERYMESSLYQSYKVMESNKGQAVQTISSREVAEMMDIRHDHLLEKIDKINKTFGNRKIGSEKYWFESTFENRGKQYREYQVTKKDVNF